jgi:hypothetical protein
MKLLDAKLTSSESYTHKLIVDEDDIDQTVLSWKVVNDEIIFKVICKTNGWIGVGVSPNGGMAGIYFICYKLKKYLLI